MLLEEFSADLAASCVPFGITGHKDQWYELNIVLFYDGR